MAIVSDAMSIAYHSHLTVYNHYYGDKDMACKCIDELPAKIMAHCNEQKAYQAKPVRKASFKDVIFPISYQGEMSTALKSDVLLTVEGRKSPKKTTMTFIYCPFCGVKYQEDV
jgi:hypothetical protein